MISQIWPEIIRLSYAPLRSVKIKETCYDDSPAWIPLQK